MLMPGRLSRSDLYRYGFNGKENDNDVKGLGNQQDYGMRIYDGRLVKFLSIDPLTKEYPWNGTYAFAENDVIRNIDVDGLEAQKSIFGIISTTSVLHVASAQEINKQHQSLTLTLDKKMLAQLESRSTTTQIQQKNKFSTGWMIYQGISSGGQIGLDQNPVLSVSLTKNSVESVIQTNANGERVLKTTNILEVTEVNLGKANNFGDLKAIQITTTTITTTQKITNDGKNAVLSLNGKGVTSTTNTKTDKINLTDDAMINYFALPSELRESVAGAIQTNMDVKGAAIKGIVNSANKAEESIDQGNLVPDKGGYKPKIITIPKGKE